MERLGYPCAGIVMSLSSPLAKLLFESIPHGIFTVDAQGRITSFNRAATAITGWQSQEVLGRPCREVLRSDHCDLHCFLAKSVRGGEPSRDQEVTIVRRDGHSILVSVSTAGLLDSAGRVDGGVEMFRDLSVIETLRREIRGSYTVEDIISQSASMAKLQNLLPLVARSNSSVLIEGEPGTGKELVARAVHNSSLRRRGPFVALNCGALPETLAEAELFGHTQGAFTDAKTTREGLFAVADGGSLLLDEVGELPPAIQVKLLRVLEEREICPLGGREPIEIDVRILAATNKNLAGEVAAGNFREDLYYRLNVVTLDLPPLRERKEDIPLLVNHFVKHFNALNGQHVTGVSADAMTCLRRHRYPGNVRELKNAIEHAFVMSETPEIGLHNLPPAISCDPTAVDPAEPSRPQTGPLGIAEAETIRTTLRRHAGNRGATAQELGIARNTLWRKMKRYGLE
jgi:PAS domain S-box-containing protein